MDTPFEQRKSSTVSFVRLFLWIALFINGIPAVVGLKNAWGLGSLLGFSGSMLLALWPTLLISFICILGLIFTYSRRSDVIVKLCRIITAALSKLRGFGLLIYFILLLFITYCFLFGVSIPVIAGMPFAAIFGNLALLGAVVLVSIRKMKPHLALLVSASLFSLILVVVSLIPEITPYPFTMTWSDGSRFYEASLIFPRLVYGKHVPLPLLDPTRALLQSIPFLIPSLPIWVHRLWRVLLWLGVTFLAAHALVQRIKPKSHWLRLGLFAWFTIFTFQGPIYFHLLMVAVIVLLGFDKNRLGKTMVFVGMASVWAGLSRVNWFPVAGMLAAVLYILEVPQNEKRFWRYWAWPVIAVFLSLGLAFGVQRIYILISGISPEDFMTSFNSTMLWYRLLPSAAYGKGVIGLLLVAGAPLILVIVWRIWGSLKAWRSLRLLGLLSILLALMAAGLIVSAKIGGGNNLHNLDSSLVILAVITVYILFDQFVKDDQTIVLRSPLPNFLFVIVFLVPMITQAKNLYPIQSWDLESAQDDLQQLQALIDDVDPEEGEVLFIQDRHLLPMGLIKNVDLVPEYEKIILMEMAMSHYDEYLQKFQNDLETHRFALIVMEPINLVIQTSEDSFGEENNAWVEWVAQPLSESYHTVLDLSDNGMIIMAPNN